MQNQRIAKRQFFRFEQDIERIPHTGHAARAPGLVCMNSHAVRASRRDVVLIVMMGEIDVVHANPPAACVPMRQDAKIGWLFPTQCPRMQSNKREIT